ncbi:MAG: DUF6516 family protein [Nitrococcus sp.]|nr:DUF6516 family protein [Nitrococcus sp.]
MRTVPLFKDKRRFSDGAIIEIVIWRLPDTDAERPHGLKYRLYYGKAGQRLVGYDNERGKGDHKHFEGKELAYAFTTVERLIGDFFADVARLRGEL